MHLINQQILGTLIIFLLAVLVAIKRITTGSLFEKPTPDLLLWLVNIFNLFFLLVANPFAAILLITGQITSADPTFLAITPSWFLMIVEIVGFIVYLAGFLLMGWALTTLGKNYQLGGSDPRSDDALIVSGPYAILRHPMYTSALCIAFGLACLIQSLGCFAAFIVYSLLILLLIPVEEESLLKAYGEQYSVYRQKVRKLVPFVF